MRNKNHIYLIFRFILDTYGNIMKIKIMYIVFVGLFYTVMELLCEKNHIYCVFRIILDTYGIIMRNKNHIYCVFRIILDTYGNIMKIKIIYIVFFGLF